MLRVLNKEKQGIGLIDSNDIKISKEINTLDIITCSLKKSHELANKIDEEFYFEDEDNIYIVKSKDIQKATVKFEAILNVDEIKGKALIDGLGTKATDVIGTLRLAIAGTGWIIEDAGAPIKKRSIDIKNTSNAWAAVEQIIKKWKCEYRVDSKNKKIIVKDSFSKNKGVYFSNELNALSIGRRSETSNLITRLIPIGKDGLKINDINSGKSYVENFQYTDKVIEQVWEDNRYTVAEDLKEDAILKLDELSKPNASYTLTIKDLASINPEEYGFLSYELGDIITIIDTQTNFKDEQRIVKMDIYKYTPNKNSLTIANKFKSFTDKQKEQEETTETIDLITNENGTIDGTKVENLKNNLEIHEIKVDILDAVKINVGELVANKADIDDLHATNAEIINLKAHKADVTELTAVSGKINILESEVAKIGVLEGDVANVKDVIAGNISSDNIQSGGITGDRLNMNTVFINDANIVNVNASKLNAGEIDTSKVKVKSADGAIEIAGATQQFKDKNNKVRIQMGKDTKGDFNFILRSEDGTTTLIDHNGVKESAIADDLIKDNMISGDAVGEKQINYNSFTNGFNKDTNTSTLKATKVKLDNQNQTLEVGFTQLKNQADGTKTQTESNTTQINVSNGKIETAIANTKIVKDGKEVLLKDDYNTTVATVDSMKNTISSHTTKIDANTGKIGTVESKTNVLERDLNSMSSKISATETTVNTHTTEISTANTNASNAQNTANTAVSKADKAQNDATSANNKVDNIQIGGRNYIILSKLSSYTPYNSVVNENGIIKLKMVSNSYITLSIGGFTPKNKKYTMSGIAKLNGNLIPKDFFKNNKANTYNGGSSIIVVENDGRFRITETWVGNSIWLLHCNTTAVKNDIVTFEKLKFEEGEKNTDFTESPEDIQQQIDKNKNDIITVNTEVTTTKNKVSGIEQDLDSVTTRVGSVESTTTSHTATINNHTSSLNAVDGKINTAKTDAINTANANTQNKADKALADAKTFTNTEITKVNSTMSSKFAEIKTTTDSITQSVSNTNKEIETVKVNINNKIDNLEVGGRNFFKESGNFEIKTSSWSNNGGGLIFDTLVKYNEFNTIKTTVGTGITGIWYKLDNNVEYTYSILVKANKTFNINNSTPLHYHAGLNNTNQGKISIIKVSKGYTSANKWQKIYITFKLTGDANSFKPFIYFGSANDVVMNIANMKLEKGNQSTDWTAAPEDISKEILDITTEKVNQAKADIKVTTDAISSKVSQVESTTNSVNGKVSEHESRITSAEQKITSSAIINTVSQTIDNKVGVVNNRVTEVTQNLEGFKVSTSKKMNKYNLLDGGNLRGTDNTKSWTMPINMHWRKIGDNVGLGRGDNGNREAVCYSAPINIQNTGRQISISARGFAENHTYGGQVFIIGSVHNNMAYDWTHWALGFDNNEGWVTKAANNIWIPDHINYITIRIDHEGKEGVDGTYFYLDWINVVKGDTAYTDGALEGNGFTEGITTINTNGVRCDFEDGSYASMGRNGLRYYKNGMSNPYQYITFNSRIAAIRNGHWRNVRLPDAFRGKQINHDFQLFVTLGNYNLNAYVSGSINGALRVAFAEWSGWDANNCTINIRPCFQKIGLNTNNLYGWDAGSTSAGGVANEGEGDVIIFAQM